MNIKLYCMTNMSLAACICQDVMTIQTGHIYRAMAGKSPDNIPRAHVGPMILCPRLPLHLKMLHRLQDAMESSRCHRYAKLRFRVENKEQHNPWKVTGERSNPRTHKMLVIPCGAKFASGLPSYRGEHKASRRCASEGQRCRKFSNKLCTKMA